VLDLDAAATTLAEKAATLDAERAALVEPPSDAGSIQFGKRAGDATNVAAEQLSRVATVEQLDIVRGEVARARAKLVEGSYGTCDQCRRPIAPERLTALPWATKCVDCQSGSGGRRRRFA
jgi:DnaK suppressor protein